MPSDRANAMSAMARPIRPLPSSNGWIVTNQICAIAAFSTRSTGAALSSNQARKRAISSGTRLAAGASKWMVSRSGGPEATIMWPSVRHAPTVTGFHRPPPSGNSHRCHSNSRSAVSGWAKFCVASSTTEAIASALRSTGLIPPVGSPRRFANEERT